MAASGSKMWMPGQSFARFFADTGTVGQDDGVENPEVELFDLTTLGEEPASPHAGPENEGKVLQQEIEPLNIKTLEEQPASPHAEAEDDGKYTVYPR